MAFVADPGMLVGELAALAGLTSRTIRHYEALGLITAARRDANGYRRYGPETLLEIAQIRRLRGVGMSLRDIAALKETPDAGYGDLLTARLGDLEDQLAGEIAQLQTSRQRVHEIRLGLERGEPVLANPTPATFAPVADALRGAGVSEAGVQIERRVWAALDAIELPPLWRQTIADGLAKLRDVPEVGAVVAELLDVIATLRDVAPDDPRVSAASARLVELVQGRPADVPTDLLQDPAVVPVLVALASCFSPAQRAAFVAMARSIAPPTARLRAALLEQGSR